MTEIKKALRLGKVEYYETHLSIVNCIIPPLSKMTPMEIKVLASFMSLEGDIAQHRFGSSGRRIVMDTLTISSSGLSGYISTLTTKGAITGKGDYTSILPLLMPEPNQQEYRFRLTKDTSQQPSHETEKKQGVKDY